MSDEAIKTLTDAFICCRLDYCNVLLCGIAEGLLNRLQSVQYAASRLVKGRREHITPVMRQFHCLPVRQRWSTVHLQELHRPTCPTSVTSTHLLEWSAFSSCAQLTRYRPISRRDHNGYGDRCFKMNCITVIREEH